MKLNTPTLKTALAFSLFIFNFSFAHAQTCNPAALATTPDADFTVHNDGTVTHNPTGLMWKVCSEGQTWNAGDGSCSGTATTHTWQAALQIPQTLNAGGGFAGHSDWRLPNLKELTSITELKCYDPAINETIFNNTPPNWYWSSSPIANNSYVAWDVYFGYGQDINNHRVDDPHVRLVRSRQ